ncbi:MAG: toll/interleukin-1 receptor domain-containing protein, partial [Verrucomicrobia bacterium]|nr:toll/interleukin-1 receptor domain-containing protein [Verrucomicrobiota bacterium]
MALDVLISYAFADKLAADAACAALEAACIRCWIAPRNVLPGVDNAEAIIEAIDMSHSMLLIFSSNANRSEQVTRDVQRAVQHGIPIIPFRIEDVPPARTLDCYLDSSRWLDALTPPFEQHLRELASTIQILLDRAGANQKHAVIGPQTPTPQLPQPVPVSGIRTEALPSPGPGTDPSPAVLPQLPISPVAGAGAADLPVKRTRSTALILTISAVLFLLVGG